MCGLSSCLSRGIGSPSASSSRSPAAEDFRTAEKEITGKAHSVGCKIALFAEGGADFIVSLEKSDIVVESIAGFRCICGVGMGPVEILPKFGRRSTPALFAYSCIKETDLFFAEGARGRNMEKTSAPEQTAKYPSA